MTWLLSLFPWWFAHLLVTVGFLAIVASMLLKRVPAIAMYNTVLRYGGIVLFVVGIYMAGIAANEAKWQERIQEMEEAVKKAEEQARQQNIVVQEKVVEKTKVVKEKGDAVIQYVDRVVKGDTQIIEKNLTEEEKAAFRKKIEELEKMQKECPVVPKLVVESHNEAATPPMKGAKK